MGLGLSITTTEARWPEEVVPVMCSVCGSGLALTRFERIADHAPTGETEQYCPVCGAAACEEETKGKSTKASDFFSGFRK